ncbi:MAG: efflux RND transporter permease subunit, partial [Planctomycetaceae bacterium]
IGQAAAAVQLALASERSAEADEAEAAAGRRRIESEVARLTSESQRLAGLAESGAVTQRLAEEALQKLAAAESSLEELAAAVQSAAARRGEARAASVRAEADLKAMEARAESAQADVQRLQTLCGYLQIRAPFSGTVAARTVDPGDLAQAGNGSRAMFRIVETSRVRVTTRVPEADAVQIGAGSAAVVRIPALQQKQFSGAVARTSWTLDEQTRTLLVEIDLENTDGVLRPGMYASVELIVGQNEQALVVPKGAVVQHEGAPVCLVVGADGVLQLRLQTLRKVAILRQRTTTNCHFHRSCRTKTPHLADKVRRLKRKTQRLQSELQRESVLRDVQIVQSLEYPTVDVKIDRERAGLAGATTDQISRSVLAATSSSRFVVPSYWPDPKSGIGYQVQIEIPQPALKSVADLGAIPVLKKEGGAVLLRDVADLSSGKMPGEFDRYNMKRELSLTASVAGADLGAAAARVDAVVRRVKQRDDELKDEQERAGVQPKPGRITSELRGQIPPLRQMTSGRGVGLVLAVVAIFLMLSASFQSFRLALAAVTTVPAVLAGSALLLLATGTTVNIQSFIGVIMSLGVSMANAILLISFAEQQRRAGVSAALAAEYAVTERSRAILMTSAATPPGCRFRFISLR